MPLTKARNRMIAGAPVSVLDFGAKLDGVTDDTAAVNAALAAADVVVVPEGTCNITGVTITRSGAKLIGMGPGASILKCTNAGTPAVTVNAFLTDVSIIGLTISRSVASADGGHGIRWIESSSYSLIHNCRITSHWIGISLCSTDFSTLSNLIVENNAKVGVYMTNNSTNGAVQWSLYNVLSHSNGDQGYLVQTSPGPSSVALGTWIGVATWNNVGVGVGIVGTANVPVHGFRLYDSFLGEDGNHELFLETYGSLHKISNCLMELSGTRPAGVGTGVGIEITANNIDVQIANCTISHNANNGIRIGGGVVQVTGCSIKDNGRTMASFARFGIYTSGTGRAILNGNVIGNTPGIVLQEYGIGFAANGTHIVNGNDLTGNVSQGLYTGVAIPSAVVTGNIPKSINVYS